MLRDCRIMLQKRRIMLRRVSDHATRTVGSCYVLRRFPSAGGLHYQGRLYLTGREAGGCKCRALPPYHKKDCMPPPF